MKNDNVISLEDRAILQDPLTDLLRTGASRLLEQGVDDEVQELRAETPLRQDKCRLFLISCVCGGLIIGGTER